MDASAAKRQKDRLNSRKPTASLMFRGVQIVDLAFIAMLSRYAVQIESQNQYLISGATNRPARHLQTATGATKRPNYGAQERRLALGSCPSWRVRSGCAELISQ